RVARSVAVIGRAKAAGAWTRASAARLASMSFFMRRRVSIAAGVGARREWDRSRLRLDIPPGQPRDLAGHQFLDDLGQALIEPVLEHRLQHLADHRLERACIGGLRLSAL